MPTPNECYEIIHLVKERKYWRALGYSKKTKAASEQINNAHLRLCHKFRDHPEVLNALNLAKAEIKEERNIGKRQQAIPLHQRIVRFSNTLINPLINIAIFLPVRILAVIGTVLVLLRLHNIFVTFVGLITAVMFVRPLYKNNNNSDSFSFVLSVLIISWVGYTASVYLILGTFIAGWHIELIFLSSVIAVGLLIYPFLPFERGILDRLSYPSLVKSISIFCVLFMFTFGGPYLFIEKRQLSQKTIASKPAKIIPPVLRTTHQEVAKFVPRKAVVQPASKAEMIQRPGIFVGILVFILKLSLLFILITAASGAYYGVEPFKRWEGFSEPRLYFAVTLCIFTGELISEILSFIPFIGKYIAGDIIILARRVAEPFFPHFFGFIFYQIIFYLYAFAIYDLYVKFQRTFSKDKYSPVKDRVWRYACAYFLGASLVSSTMPLVGWASPVKSGYAGFFESVLTSRTKKAIQIEPVLAPIPQEKQMSKEKKESLSAQPGLSFNDINKSPESVKPDIADTSSSKDMAADENTKTEWLWGEVVFVDRRSNNFALRYTDFDTGKKEQIIIDIDNRTTYKNINSIDEIKPQNTLSVVYIIDPAGRNIAEDISLER